MAKEPRRKVVVITGMHRSGTSLTASIVQNSGLDIGERIMGPAPGNRRGHFEDMGFYEFHQDVMARLGLSFLAEESIPLEALLQSEIDRARNLIKLRDHKRLWGWKDPRTCLFLTLWRRLIPEAKYIFVYRHPLEVVLSLIRRCAAVDLAVFKSPWTGLKSWEAHNRGILSLLRDRREDSFVCHVSQILSNTEQFVDRVAQKLSLPLDPSGSGQLCHTDEMKFLPIPPAADKMLGQALPSLMATYRELNECADLPDIELQSGKADERRRVSIDAVLDESFQSKSSDTDLRLRMLTVLLDPEGVEHAHHESDRYIRSLESALGIAPRCSSPGQTIYQEFSTIQRRLSDREVELASARAELSTIQHRCSVSDAELAGLRTEIARLQRALMKEEWRRLLVDVQTIGKNRRVLIWGAGGGGRRVARFFKRQGVRFAAFVDSNPAKSGRRIVEHPVIPALALKRTRVSARPFVVIGSVFHREISRQLRKLGFQDGKDFVRAPERLPQLPSELGTPGSATRGAV